MQPRHRTRESGANDYYGIHVFIEQTIISRRKDEEENWVLHYYCYDYNERQRAGAGRMMPNSVAKWETFLILIAVSGRDVRLLWCCALGAALCANASVAWSFKCHTLMLVIISCHELKRVRGIIFRRRTSRNSQQESRTNQQTTRCPIVHRYPLHHLGVLDFRCFNPLVLVWLQPELLCALCSVMLSSAHNFLLIFVSI